MGQYQHYNDPYNDDLYDDRYDDDYSWDYSSAQGQYRESSCFLDNQESDKSSFSKKLDQMLEMLKETLNKEEVNSKLIFAIEDQLERITDQLKQQSPGKPSDTTQVNEISCREGVIDMIFGNHKVRFLLFRPTNDPPISGDMFVINTIDDYVYEHTTNMLYDTTHNLEKHFPCHRLIEFDRVEFQQVKKKLWIKKHDVVLTHKSKMKMLHDTKHRVNKSINKNYA
ncbi:unnamed protein product [Lactuca saligna]|uniref:Uncharacterized protein n=1 Tax=Lactuca saligna TaxID=75948 RepID=A0AA35VC74_LACSI|nr:unnamed protein product [Lactuca saligna]